MPIEKCPFCGEEDNNVPDGMTIFLCNGNGKDGHSYVRKDLASCVIGMEEPIKEEDNILLGEAIL